MLIQGDNASCDQPPSFVPLCPLIRCQSYPRGKNTLTLQHRRPRGHVLWEHFSPLPAGGSLQCPPLPVISHTVLMCTLPVTETAALEEQVAAGHRANLTWLLKPDGRRRGKKKREKLSLSQLNKENRKESYWNDLENINISSLQMITLLYKCECI